MARKAGRERYQRPLIALWPAPLISLGAIFAAAMLLGLARVASGTDIAATIIWALPGIYFLMQPVRGLVRGQGEQVRIGFRTLELAGLQKVAVYERRTWGIKHAVAVLKSHDRVEDVSGLMMSTKSFTEFVRWLAVPTETLQGQWLPRQLANARPDLALKRPEKPKA